MKTSLFRTVAFALFLGLAGTASLQAQLTNVGIVNAASFQAGFPLSPACWATAFADFESVGVSTAGATSTPFPTMLGGVQVFVNDVAAPMNFVNGQQVNFLVPKGTQEGRATIRIEVSGMTVYEGEVNIWAVSPGLLFDGSQPDTRPGRIRNQDDTVNGPSNRAARGEVIQIFGVGADFPLNELPDDGEVAPTDTLIRTMTEPVGYVDTVEADIQFSGAAPNLVNAWQLNIFVPENSFISGQVTVVAEIGGLKSNIVSVWVDE